MFLKNHRTFLILVLLNFLVKNTWSKPFSKSSNREARELLSTLEKFLNLYYDTHSQDFDKTYEHHSSKKHKKIEDSEEDRYHEPKRTFERRNERSFEEYQDSEDSEDIYDRMQGDQPMERQDSGVGGVGLSNNEEMESALANQRARDKRSPQNLEGIKKDSWKEQLKNHILRTLGRENLTLVNDSPPTTEDPALPSINFPDLIPTIMNTTYQDDDQITEKIRSFYPSCESPPTDTDVWKDEDIMNLYFDIDYLSANSNSNIATATLRLYRVPQNSTSTPANAKDNNCDNPESAEEEKLLRVTVYWYTKSQKKRRGKHVTDVKRRLSDSRMVSENARWVELSVKPATKAWNKVNAKNLGLGVLVEDQEGKALRADKYFKGAACTVGMCECAPPPNQSQPSSKTWRLDSQTNLTEFIAYLEGIQTQPYIVIYSCSPQSTSAS